MTPSSADNYRLAAHCFADLVDTIDANSWDDPGLGEWNLRALVGHTARALSTVVTYLKQPAAEERITSTAQYYAFVRQYSRDAGAGTVADRGRVAGAGLGEDPARAVRALMNDALTALDAASGDPIIETLGGGMRLSAYLPTRTFELAVHLGDIAAAITEPVAIPDPVLEEALGVAVSVATLFGDGPALLRALTGREPLPDGFSIV
jgi:uncharacterized protein (TIGR03083 family)